MEYIKSLVLRTQSLRLIVVLSAAAGSVVLQNLVQAVLNGFYERSGYPVPYYVGQTSFSAEKLEGWYATMDAAGTLGVYWQTQLVDFAFVAATALAHFWVLALVARLLPVGRWRSVAAVVVVVGLLAPAFDALENLLSFIALSDPTSISPAVAIVYSSFAVLKFAGFVAVYLWVPVGLAVAAIRAVSSARSARIETA